DQAFSDRVAGQARDVVDVELGHEVHAVRVDGFHADAESLRDLAVGAAAGDELEDLRFAAGEHRLGVLDVAALGPAAGTLAHGAQDLRREIGAPGHGGADAVA